MTCLAALASILLAAQPPTPGLPTELTSGLWSVTWRREHFSPAIIRGLVGIRTGADATAGRAWLETLYNGQGSFEVGGVSWDGAQDIGFTLTRNQGSFRFHGRLLTADLMDGSVEWTASNGLSQVDAFSAEHRAVPFFDGQRAGRTLARWTGAHPSVDELALSRLVLRAQETNSDALIVVADGNVVSERYSGRTISPLSLQSITKPLSGLAIGQMYALGLIESLDVPLTKWLPEAGGGPLDDVTLRHVLTHTSGLDPGDTQLLNRAPDKVDFALRATRVADPGSMFAYNNRASELLTVVASRVTGTTIDRWLTASLFAPAGLSSVQWPVDARGHPSTYGGLMMSPMDLAVVGQVLLDGGRLGEEQLVPECWLVESTAPNVQAAPGIGLQWFLAPSQEPDPSVFWHSGSCGQYFLVFPESRIVIVRMAHISYDPTSDNDTTEFTDILALSRDVALGAMLRRGAAAWPP
jgi:CubicO group peptidase (beta-lactamase class C family)